MKTRLTYGLLALAIFLGEVVIALFVHDNFIRPFVGDVLVILLLYFAIRTVFPTKIKRLPVWLFLFGAAVEGAQYFRIVELLGLQSIPFFKVLIGTTFDWRDILCYAAGAALALLFERKKS